MRPETKRRGHGASLCLLVALSSTPNRELSLNPRRGSKPTCNGISCRKSVADRTAGRSVMKEAVDVQLDRGLPISTSASGGRSAPLWILPGFSHRIGSIFPPRLMIQVGVSPIMYCLAMLSCLWTNPRHNMSSFCGAQFGEFCFRFLQDLRVTKSAKRAQLRLTHGSGRHSRFLRASKITDGLYRRT